MWHLLPRALHFLEQCAAGRVLITVIGYYALGLLGVPWLLCAGEDWRTVSMPLAITVILAAPVVVVVLAFILSYAVPEKRDHENIVKGREWRMMVAPLAVLWVNAPILAHLAGGWFDGHRYWSLLAVPLAFGLIRVVFRCSVRIRPAILDFADRLPPGSSSTRLS